MFLTPAPIDNGYDDMYVFDVSYTIIRQGDKGKVLQRPRRESIGSPYYNGKNLPQMIKDKYGENTIIEAVEFVEQYNIEEKFKKLNGVI